MKRLYRFAALSLLSVTTAVAVGQTQPDGPPCIVNHAEAGFRFHGERNPDGVVVTAISPNGHFIVVVRQAGDGSTPTEAIRFARRTEDAALCARHESEMSVVIDGNDHARETRANLCTFPEMNLPGAPDLRTALAGSEEISINWFGRDPEADSDSQSLGGYEVGYPSGPFTQLLGLQYTIAERLQQVYAQSGCAAVHGSIDVYPGP